MDSLDEVVNSEYRVLGALTSQTGWTEHEVSQRFMPSAPVHIGRQKPGRASQGERDEEENRLDPDHEREGGPRVT